MDKSSNIFLKGEIRRIVNLNERIESASFLLETLDSNTTDNINKIRDYLLQKNIKDEVINKFINDTLIAQFNAGKCGKGNGVKCEHLSNYILNKIIDPDTNISDEVDINKFYDPIDKKYPKDLKIEVEAYLGIGTSKPTGFKPSGVFVDQLIDRMDAEKELMMAHFNVDESGLEKELIERKKELLRGEFCPKCKSEDEISRRFESWLGDIRSTSAIDKIAQETADNWIAELDEVRKNRKIIISDERFEEIKKNLREKLIDGSFCKGCKKKSTRDKWRRHLNKFGSDKLTKADVDSEMEKFDRDVYPLIVKNLPDGKNWGNQMRTYFETLLVSGELCPDCKTKEDILRKAKEEREEMKYYAVEGEEMAVNFMVQFKMRVAKAEKIYKEFMTMWGLSPGDIGEKGKDGETKEGTYTIKNNDLKTIKITYLNDTDGSIIDKAIPTTGDSFTKMTLQGRFREAPRGASGNLKFWFLTKGKFAGTVGIGIADTTITSGEKIDKAFFQSNVKDPGNGDNILTHYTPIQIDIK